MKAVFLSIIAVIFGQFCDILRSICQKSAERRIKRGELVTKKPLVLLGRFTEKCFESWQKLEKKLIFLLLAE